MFGKGQTNGRVLQIKRLALYFSPQTGGPGASSRLFSVLGSFRLPNLLECAKRHILEHSAQKKQHRSALGVNQFAPMKYELR